MATLIGSIDRLALLRLSMAGSAQILISSLSSSGVINGPPAAALAWRAIAAAVDLRVTPLPPISRASIARAASTNRDWARHRPDRARLFPRHLRPMAAARARSFG